MNKKAGARFVLEDHQRFKSLNMRRHLLLLVFLFGSLSVAAAAEVKLQALLARCDKTSRRNDTFCVGFRAEPSPSVSIIAPGWVNISDKCFDKATCDVFLVAHASGSDHIKWDFFVKSKKSDHISINIANFQSMFLYLRGLSLHDLQAYVKDVAAGEWHHGSSRIEGNKQGLKK